MNAWLKRCVFNLDLNRESVSEPRTLSGRLFQSMGAKYEEKLIFKNTNNSKTLLNVMFSKSQNEYTFFIHHFTMF